MDMKDELNRAADMEFPHLPESATIASQYLRIAERAACPLSGLLRERPRAVMPLPPLWG